MIQHDDGKFFASSLLVHQIGVVGFDTARPATVLNFHQCSKSSSMGQLRLRAMKIDLLRSASDSKLHLNECQSVRLRVRSRRRFDANHAYVTNDTTRSLDDDPVRCPQRIRGLGWVSLNLAHDDDHGVLEGQTRGYDARRVRLCTTVGCPRSRSEVLEQLGRQRVRFVIRAFIASRPCLMAVV